MTEPKKGSRATKRAQTLRHIADVALQLFLSKGFAQTTIDEIAEAANISRRGFFLYYKSKEEILYVWLGDGLAAAIKPGILAEPKQKHPLDTVRRSLLKLVDRMETKESLAIDRLFQSSEMLKSRKQALFVEMEQGAYDALCVLYPQKKQRPYLRTVAMASIGALRLALDHWREEKASRRVAEYLNAEFASLARLDP
jgi:AcrR family transcriptional regulator